jgi:hypothetical protein
MGSEEEEPNLSEDLLTVREEQSGLFTPRLEHIKARTGVRGRVIQVMATASKGNVAQGTRESEGIYIPSEGVLTSSAYESRRHKGRRPAALPHACRSTLLFMPEEASKRQRLWWRCDEANRPAGARPSRPRAHRRAP